MPSNTFALKIFWLRISINLHTKSCCAVCDLFGDIHIGRNNLSSQRCNIWMLFWKKKLGSIKPISGIFLMCLDDQMFLPRTRKIHFTLVEILTNIRVKGILLHIVRNIIKYFGLFQPVSSIEAIVYYIWCNIWIVIVFKQLYLSVTIWD